MADSHIHQLFESAVSAAQASISVILVLPCSSSYPRNGPRTVRRMVSLREDTASSIRLASNISRLATSILLPALLFSEIGPLAIVDNIKSCEQRDRRRPAPRYRTLSKLAPKPCSPLDRADGIIIPITLVFQLVSYAFARASAALGMPSHFVVTSLPLLLLHALSQTGALDSLVRPGEPLSLVLSRGRVYILINALVGNLTRFAFGPYLLSGGLKPEGQIRLPSDHLPGAFPVARSTVGEEPGSPPAWKRISRRLGKSLRKAASNLTGFLNPPLLGGLAACFFGLISWSHHQLFDQDGWLTPLSDSINNVGNLYTVLQMFILGGHLYSKPGSKTSYLALLWLFAFRFCIMPAISISTIHLIRVHLPHLLRADPVLDFVLMLSNVGPPALTLSAIAEMTELGPRIEGQIARTLTASYIVTPLIALTVTAALEVVERSYR
ncbi:BQ2448_7018 [Microbotryum intermedium]|uniref:BQ2448_7018 protein n=1 Tax=Microbotryum intermedium TaxID=269621 RepID=A0A238FM45_9BASI|nr:BQ2448_7018 [Microbotryum intermedium]